MPDPRNLRVEPNYTPTTYDMVAALQFYTGQTWHESIAMLERWRSTEGNTIPLEAPEEPAW